MRSWCRSAPAERWVSDRYISYFVEISDWKKLGYNMMLWSFSHCLGSWTTDQCLASLCCVLFNINMISELPQTNPRSPWNKKFKSTLCINVNYNFSYSNLDIKSQGVLSYVWANFQTCKDDVQTWGCQICQGKLANHLKQLSCLATAKIPILFYYA